jgi:hypothetical protein
MVMNVTAPLYRLRTVVPVSRAAVRSAFADWLVEPANEAADSWPCKDGSGLVFSQSAEAGSFYIELQCRFRPVIPGGIDYGPVWCFLDLCKVHGERIKIVSGNRIYPASAGALLSDMLRSPAHRIASHLAAHPKDA